MRKRLKYLLLIIFLLAAAIGVPHVISALTCDHNLQYWETAYVSPQISPKLNGYVIAFLSDTHDLTASEMQAIVERINARNVDLLLLGGDFRSFTAGPTLKVLANTKTTDGIYGVMGNHDLYNDIKDNMAKYGITFLYNRGHAVRPGFFLGGVSDLDTHKPRVHEALENAATTDFVLLLSHNPSLALEHDVSRANLMLAGHTHGGLMNFFGLWSPALALRNPKGNKLRSGWYKVGATDILVSNGTGYTEKIPRVFARPQVIFLTLKAE